MTVLLVLPPGFGLLMAGALDMRVLSGYAITAAAIWLFVYAVLRSGGE